LYNFFLSNSPNPNNYFLTTLSTGFDFIATARLFHRLMVERIGHRHYLAQGGDWGSMIISILGRLYPQNVLGIHMNVAFIQPFLSVRHFIKALIGCYFPSLVFSEPEHFQHYSISAQFKELLLESGYYHIQVALTNIWHQIQIKINIKFSKFIAIL
jgi:hypothetical protein